MKLRDLPNGSVLLRDEMCKVGIRWNAQAGDAEFINIPTGKFLAFVPRWASVETAMDIAWTLNTFGHDSRVVLTGN